MSVYGDFKNIDCKGDLLKQLIPIIIDKLHKLVEIAGSVKKLCMNVKKEDISCLPCANSSTKTVKDWHSSTMDTKTADRETIISYINLLKRNNCQKLILLLNHYWASAAFEDSDLDCRKIAELNNAIRNHSSTILKICPIQPMACEEVNTKKRSNPYPTDEEAKKKKIEEPQEF